MGTIKFDDIPNIESTILDEADDAYNASFFNKAVRYYTKYIKKTKKENIEGELNSALAFVYGEVIISCADWITAKYPDHMTSNVANTLIRKAQKSLAAITKMKVCFEHRTDEILDIFEKAKLHVKNNPSKDEQLQNSKKRARTNVHKDDDENFMPQAKIARDSSLGTLAFAATFSESTTSEEDVIASILSAASSSSSTSPEPTPLPREQQPVQASIRHDQRFAPLSASTSIPSPSTTSMLVDTPISTATLRSASTEIPKEINKQAPLGQRPKIVIRRSSPQAFFKSPQSQLPEPSQLAPKQIKSIPLTFSEKPTYVCHGNMGAFINAIKKMINLIPADTIYIAALSILIADFFHHSYKECSLSQELSRLLDGIRDFKGNLDIRILNIYPDIPRIIERRQLFLNNLSNLILTNCLDTLPSEPLTIEAAKKSFLALIDQEIASFSQLKNEPLLDELGDKLGTFIFVNIDNLNIPGQYSSIFSTLLHNEKLLQLNAVEASAPGQQFRP